jgi:hypothetical protein
VDHKTFNELLDRRIDRTRKVLGSKSEEYSKDGDKLYNFNRAATLRRKSPIEVCFDYGTKHLVSVIDMVEAAVAGALPDQGLVDEKIGDLINYLILLEAVFAESKSGTPPGTPLASP